MELKIYLYDVSKYFDKELNLQIFAFNKKQADNVIKKSIYKDAPFIKVSKSRKVIEHTMKITYSKTEEELVDKQYQFAAKTNESEVK